MNTTPSKHLFRISSAAYLAASAEEVQATCDALREAGLFTLPYDFVDIEVPVDVAVTWTGSGERVGTLKPVHNDDGSILGYRSSLGEAVVVRVTGVSIDPSAPKPKANLIDYKLKWTSPFADETTPLQSEENVAKLSSALSYLLITLLYTKNAVKETRVKKLAKLGIGKKRLDAKYEYVTTIRPPAAREMPDDEEHPPLADTPGEPTRRCPHLRRAHWRQQRFGPGRSYVKAILIQAMFINADREWTKTRTAYNVSL